MQSGWIASRKGLKLTPDEMVRLLPETGSISFEEFVALGQSEGAPVRMWLRLKHQGKLYAWIDESGEHRISRQPQEVNENGS